MPAIIPLAAAVLPSIIGGIASATKGGPKIPEGYQQFGAGSKGYQAGTQANQGSTNIDMGPQGQFRAGEMGLMSQLQGQANGTGPSLAQGQLAQATGANMQETAGAMQQAGGGLAPGAQRYMLAQQQGAIGQQGAQQSAQLRLQEQLQAQQALGGLSAQGRAQDIGLAEDQTSAQQFGQNFNEQQRQYGQTQAQQEQDQQNALLAGQQMQNNGAANQQASTGYSQFGGAMAGAGMKGLESYKAFGGEKAAAGGKVLTAPQDILAGEAGTEVVVPVSGKSVDMSRVKDPDLKAYLAAGGLEKTPKDKDAEEGGSDGPHMERDALLAALQHLSEAHKHLSSLGLEV